MFDVFETKFCDPGEALSLDDGAVIAGYASLFGRPDKGGDIVEPGAYAKSLGALTGRKGGVKMLWQHDPAQPIGVWDEVREDTRGLFVKGRLLTGIERGREAAEMVAAGVIDGLSIGYRTIRATKAKGGGRILQEIELWEVSLVTFPMLPEARIGAKADQQGLSVLGEVADLFEKARRDLAQD